MALSTGGGLEVWQKLRLRLGDRSFGVDDLSQLHSVEACSAEPLIALYQFLAEWFAPKPTMRLQTSGSTGSPKRIEVCKVHMMRSAEMSCRYLALGAYDVALLCMDLRYIGAMMLVVRAMICGMRLVVRAPSSAPLTDSSLEGEGLTFAALVPLQVYHALEQGSRLLLGIDRIIIGGAAVPPSLRARLRSYTNAIYATYGMTETLSHIALAPLSRGAPELIYEPLPGVSISLSSRQTLIIDAPQIGVDSLEVNDLAELVELPSVSGSMRGFRLLGRADLVINTGGVKVVADALEGQLAEWIDVPLGISYRASERLGQEIVLLLEGDGGQEGTLRRQCAEVFALLPSHHRPRTVVFVPALPRLGSGKLDRLALHALAEQES